MKTIVLIAALLALPIAAQADDGYYNFGPEKRGMLLGITKVGHTVEFRIQNTTKESITFVERMSCSGYSSFALESTDDSARARVSLGTKAKCKADEKVTRTVESGRIEVIAIELPAGRNYEALGTNIRGRARISVAGRSKPVTLSTGPLSVETDSFP